MVLVQNNKQADGTYTTSDAVKMGEYHSKTMHFSCKLSKNIS